MGGRRLRRGRPALRRADPGIVRLSAYDLHCLRVETAARPTQVGILAIVEPADLADADGALRLADLRHEIELRSRAVPELRRVIHRPGRFAGRPVWVDDPAFRIEDHVDAVVLPAPNDGSGLLAQVEELMAKVVDRSHPLWHCWFVTGLAQGRIAVLVVLHHALADGLTATRLVRALLETSPRAADPGPARALVPRPSWAELVRDNARATLGSLLQLARPARWRLIGHAVRAAWRTAALSRASAASSLNAPVGPRRRLSLVSLDRATAARVARAGACGVQDVVLSLVTGGVRALLAARGEPVERVRPRVGIAVARFSSGHAAEAGNDIGTLHVALPVDEPDPAARLRPIAAERARAMQDAMVAIEPDVRAMLGRFGFVRRAMEHQRLVNLAATYIPGPPQRIEILGAPVIDLRPIAPLAGNIGLSFVALSYAGRLSIAVRADADQFPDLDVLTSAMEADWDALSGAVAPAVPSMPAA